MSRWVQVVLITSRGQKLNRNLDKAKVFGFLETPPANLYKCNSCLFQIGCIIFPGVFLFQIGCIIFPGVFLFQIGCIIFPGVLIFLIDCIILGFPFSLRQNFPESDESVRACLLLVWKERIWQIWTFTGMGSIRKDIFQAKLEWITTARSQINCKTWILSRGWRIWQRCDF